MIISKAEGNSEAHHLQGNPINRVFWEFSIQIQERLPNILSVSFHHQKTMLDAFHILRPVGHKHWHPETLQTLGLLEIVD